MEEFLQTLQQLQRQFLCTFAVQNISWQQLKQHSSWEQQKQILDATLKHPLNQAHPVKISYQLKFLNCMLMLFEANCTEIHDELYELYCELQKRSASDSQDKFAYKHYLLPSYQTHFTLRESNSFVTKGTTGLCSWQASLALADYILHCSDLVKDKSVLELGAGTGLCGLIISRCCKVTHVCLTDGSVECVELMLENVSRNFISAKEITKGSFALKHQQLLTCRQLQWNKVEEANLKDVIKPDIVLAADVVYDTSVLEDLSNAVHYLFNMMSNKTKMLLAATVRNEETLKQFLEILGFLKFVVTEEEIIAEEKSHFFWDRSTPVKIFLITKNA